MNCEKSIRFKADMEFDRLVQPFSPEELLLVFDDLSTLKQLVFHTWEGILIDNFGYYKLALQLNVPFEICELLNKTREEIIIDICRKQLKRTDLTNIMKKYLIGKMSLAEQMKNELSIRCSGLESTKTEIRRQIGHEYAYGYNSVRDFEFGAIAIDKFFEIDQTFAENILSAKANISYSCLVTMSKLSSDKLRYIANNISKNGFNLKGLIKSINANPDSSMKYCTSVKVTPV